MNKYKLIQIICWTAVFIVFACLVIWVASGLGLGGTENNFSFNIQNFFIKYKEKGRYSVEAKDINSIDVDWVSGKVNIIPYNGSDITLVEYAPRNLKANEVMEYGVNSGKLKIKFCSYNFKKNDKMTSKRLEVFIPFELSKNLKECKIITASASVDAKDINSNILDITTVSGACDIYNINSDKITMSTSSGFMFMQDSKADEIDINSVSGKTKVDNVEAENLKINTTSGNVNIMKLISKLVFCSTVAGTFDFDGESEEIEVMSTSGRVKIINRIVPEALDISSFSGDVNVTMPKSEQISIRYSTISGKCTSDFPILSNKAKSTYNVSTGSGNITIKEL
jgi:DUF4097 and DUF4098 domain-containing protein YvlB